MSTQTIDRNGGTSLVIDIGSSIGTIMRRYKGTTSIRGRTLPGFDPALIAHYIGEGTISTKTVDVIEEARSSCNVSFTTGVPACISQCWTNAKSTGFRR